MHLHTHPGLRVSNAIVKSPPCEMGKESKQLCAVLPFCMWHLKGFCEMEPWCQSFFSVDENCYISGPEREYSFLYCPLTCVLEPMTSFVKFFEEYIVCQ